MIWIVVMWLSCDPSDKCTISKTDARRVPAAVEAEIRKQCDASPDCVEVRAGIFAIRTKRVARSDEAMQ